LARAPTRPRWPHPSHHGVGSGGDVRRRITTALRVLHRPDTRRQSSEAEQGRCSLPSPVRKGLAPFWPPGFCLHYVASDVWGQRLPAKPPASATVTHDGTRCPNMPVCQRRLKLHTFWSEPLKMDRRGRTDDLRRRSGYAAHTVTPIARARRTLRLAVWHNAHMALRACAE